MKLILVTCALGVITIACAIMTVHAMAQHRELAARVAQLEQSQAAREAQAQRAIEVQRMAEQYLAWPHTTPVDMSDLLLDQKLERLRERSSTPHSDGPARYIPLTNNRGMRP